MFKTQRCLHSDSEAFVGQTYLIKQEKRGKVGRFVLCHKKKRPVTRYRMMNTTRISVQKSQTKMLNQSAGDQRQATHAEKCTEIMRDFLKKALSPA